MSNIRFKTASGSEYELEYDEGMLHVLKVKGTPTARQTPWRMCVNTDEPKVGEPWLIHWGDFNPDGSEQCTLTSPVMEIIDA
jgi:hypothetical protein